MTDATGRLFAALLLTLCAVRDLRTQRIRRSWLFLWGSFVLTLRLTEAVRSAGQFPAAPDRWRALPAILAAGAEKTGMQALPGVVWLILARLSRGAVGEGDGWCLLLCGLTAGTAWTLEILLTASLMTAAGCVFLLIKEEKRSRKLPFVPFLAAAAWLVCAAERSGG